MNDGLQASTANNPRTVSALLAAIAFADRPPARAHVPAVNGFGMLNYHQVNYLNESNQNATTKTAKTTEAVQQEVTPRENKTKKAYLLQMATPRTTMTIALTRIIPWTTLCIRENTVSSEL